MRLEDGYLCLDGDEEGAAVATTGGDNNGSGSGGAKSKGLLLLASTEKLVKMLNPEADESTATKNKTTNGDGTNNDNDDEPKKVGGDDGGVEVRSDFDDDDDEGKETTPKGGQGEEEKDGDGKEEEKKNEQRVKKSELPENAAFQSLKLVEQLGSTIDVALRDIESCKNRNYNIPRRKYRGPTARGQARSNALENQRNRLLQKQQQQQEDRAAATNAATDASGDDDDNDKTEDEKEEEGDHNPTADPTTTDTENDKTDDDEDDDEEAKDDDAVVHEDMWIRLARVMNSIRILTPVLIPIFCHERKSDKNLEIGTRRLVKSSSPSPGGGGRNANKNNNNNNSANANNNKERCWILGERVFDVMSENLFKASYERLQDILFRFGIPRDRTTPDFIDFATLHIEMCMNNFESLKGMPTVPGWGSNHPFGKDDKLDEIARKLDDQCGLVKERDKEKDAAYEKSIEELKNRVLELLKSKEKKTKNHFDFSDARLHVYGSCLSGLSLGESSDVDMSLNLKQASEISDSWLRGELDAKRYQNKIRDLVFAVGRVLKGGRDSPFRDVRSIALARVPVVGGTFSKANNPYNSADGSLNFDICFLNDIAVANSSLLKEYAAVDPRVKHLLIAVKQWTKDNGISSSPQRTISSYTWMNMTIFYLQCLGFVPNLQSEELMERLGVKSARGPDDDDINEWHCVDKLDTFYLTWEQVRGAWTMPADLDSTMSVTSLLYGFFHFYANPTSFPSQLYAISIKRGRDRVLPKTAFARCSNFFCIEDPFETYDSHRPHDLGVHADDAGAKKIMNCLQNAAKHLHDILTTNAPKEVDGQTPPEEHIKSITVLWTSEEKKDNATANQGGRGRGGGGARNNNNRGGAGGQSSRGGGNNRRNAGRQQQQQQEQQKKEGGTKDTTGAEKSDDDKNPAAEEENSSPNKQRQQSNAKGGGRRGNNARGGGGGRGGGRNNRRQQQGGGQNNKNKTDQQDQSAEAGATTDPEEEVATSGDDEKTGGGGGGRQNNNRRGGNNRNNNNARRNNQGRRNGQNNNNKNQPKQDESEDDDKNDATAEKPSTGDSGGEDEKNDKGEQDSNNNNRRRQPRGGGRNQRNNNRGGNRAKANNSDAAAAEKDEQKGKENENQPNGTKDKNKDEPATKKANGESSTTPQKAEGAAETNKNEGDNNQGQNGRNNNNGRNGRRNNQGGRGGGGGGRGGGGRGRGRGGGRGRGPRGNQSPKKNNQAASEGTAVKQET